MRNKLFSLTATLFFNVITLSLILALFAQRTQFIAAQGVENVEAEDNPVLVPRSTQVADDEDGEDDDDDDEPIVYTYTIRPGDTLWRLAARLGVPYAVLRAQTDNPSLIHPGQKFTYTDADRIDSSIPPTDDDGTDSDGYNTPPPTTDFDGISTPPLTSYDGTDSDGYDTPVIGLRGEPQLGQQQQQSFTDNDGFDTTGNYTDNDGTDSDGFDTTGNYTDNDGTDSDGFDTTGNYTDNDGTDSDGFDTTGNENDTPDTDDTDDSDSDLVST
ncbi:MAG: LysM domain-containing protein [Chloroflexota bacterium]|nr:LysM domain-containing protein [Chloroflexota bacterium]MDE2945740.1 LysM domain-containing protein [Chloroflexota bacterium]